MQIIRTEISHVNSWKKLVFPRICESGTQPDTQLRNKPGKNNRKQSRATQKEDNLCRESFAETLEGTYDLAAGLYKRTTVVDNFIDQGKFRGKRGLGAQACTGLLLA